MYIGFSGVFTVTSNGYIMVMVTQSPLPFRTELACGVREARPVSQYARTAMLENGFGELARYEQQHFEAEESQPKGQCRLKPILAAR